MSHATQMRRIFIAAWIVLGLVGAPNHTIAEKLLGRRYALGLPHLRYGFVMFNRNPRVVPVYQYARADGIRHDLADLVDTPAPGYKRSRLAINLVIKPVYLTELCYRAVRSLDDELTIFVDHYRVDVDARRPALTQTFRCDVHGLAAR